MVKYRYRKVHSGHVKHAGITKTTLEGYRKMLRKFFGFLHVHGIEMPKCLDSLDDTMAEYVNHMYQEGESHGYATESVSALKRFYPRCKKHMSISSHYTKCWSKELNRLRATPLPSEILIGMVGMALARGEPRVAITVLVGFIGLLRTGELLSLVPGQINFFGGVLAVISLAESKGSKRKDFSECVLIHDGAAVRLLKSVVASLPADEKIFPGPWALLHTKLVEYAGKFGLAEKG